MKRPCSQTITRLQFKEVRFRKNSILQASHYDVGQPRYNMDISLTDLGTTTTITSELLTLSLANNDYNSYLYDGEPGPAPSMSNPGIIATNITKKYLSACKSRSPTVHRPLPRLSKPRRSHDDANLSLLLLTHTALETGEIVKDGYFTLFEAVGALEVCTCHSHICLTHTHD